MSSSEAAFEAKKSALLKRQLLKYDYGKQYKEWDGNFTDDRQLFCNLFEMLNEAVDAMETVTNNMVWVAFNKYFWEQEQTLVDIKNHFCNQRKEAE